MNTVRGAKTRPVSRQAQSVGFCQHGTEPSSAMKMTEFSTFVSANDPFRTDVQRACK